MSEGIVCRGHLQGFLIPALRNMFTSGFESIDKAELAFAKMRGLA